MQVSGPSPWFLVPGPGPWSWSLVPGPGPWSLVPGPGPAQGRPNGQKMIKKDKKMSDQDVSKAFWEFPGPKSIAEGPGTSWNHSGALKPQEKIKNQGILGLGGLGGSGPLLVPLKGPRGPGILTV